MTTLQSIILTFLIGTVLWGCNNESRNAPAPTKKDGPVIEKEQGSDKSSPIPDDSDNEPSKEENDEDGDGANIVMIEEELSKSLTEDATALLHLGTYHGLLDDGRNCKVVVEPLTTQGKDFQVNVVTEPDPSHFYFIVGWTHPLALSFATTTSYGLEGSMEFRLDMQVIEPIASPNGELRAMIMHLSVKTNPDGSVNSIYVHNQTKNDSQEALALCRIESYSEIIEDLQ